MTKQDILNAIAAGDLDGDLETLPQAVGEAVLVRYKNRPAPTFRPGDRVYFNGYAGRKSSVGQVGTVVEKKQKNYVVKLDVPEQRKVQGMWRTVDQVRCPASIISPLPADAEIFHGTFLQAIGAAA